MKHVFRRFLAASCALAVVAGCGASPSNARSTAPSSAVTPPSDVVGDEQPAVDSTEPVRFERVLLRAATLGAETLKLQAGQAQVNADRPATRIAPPVIDIAPPVIELEESDEDGTLQIEQVWLDLAECESNQRWDYNGSSGFDGGLQFLPATWRGVGGTDFAEYAWQATPFEQVTVAERLLDVQGWGAWPTCSRKLGLR